MPFPIPNAKSTFLDQNGVPLAAGQVFTYVPGTTDPSNTYTDQTLSVANPNPIVLDQAGTCVMWGDGYFRQVVRDMFGNLIWDYTTGIEIDTLQGPVTINGGLTVNGPTQLNGTLDTTGGATIGGGLSVAGATDLNGSTSIQNGLTVTGGLTTDNEDVTGNLNVGGQTQTGSLVSTGPANFDSNVGIAGGLTVGESLGVGGPTTLDSTLNVGGDTTLDQNLTVGGNEQINGNLNVNGTITSGGGGTQPGQTLVLAVTETNISSGTFSVNTNECMIIWTFDPTQNYNISVNFPGSPPVGFFFTWSNGLYGYSGSGIQQVAYNAAGGGSIDQQGSTFNVTLDSYGETYCFLHTGGNNWKMYLWSV